MPNNDSSLFRGFSTRAIHIGQEPEQLTGSVTVPLYQTSTFAQDGIGQDRGFEYARTQNPTRQHWERNIAALEGGARGFAFGSGMAAVDAILRLLSSGDHVIAAEDMYGGTFRLFDKVLRRYGLEFSYVDMTNHEAIRQAIRPQTKMVYSETPTNPMMMLTDLAAVAEIAHQAGALFVVDNTFASPYFQNPIALGADIVFHSATKYLGGHSDLVHGVVVVANEDLGNQMHFIQNGTGGVPSPFDCWLCLRSAKTLAVRMERHAANAMALARYCETHPKVKKVYYPGLESHPQHELAKRQMRGFGGMLSLELESTEVALSFAKKVQVFTLAESLGGVESLLCYPETMTHASIPEPTRRRLGITPALVRLSVGIEDVDDLLADVEQALSA